MAQLNEWGAFYQLGETAMQQGDLAQACEAFTGAVAKAEAAGDLSGQIHCLTPLAAALAGSGQVGAALQVAARTLELVRGARGERHPDTAVARGNLAQYLQAAGDAEGAERELRLSLDSLEIQNEVAERRVALENLAQFLLGQGRLPEALPLWQRLEQEAEPGSELLARSLLTLAHVHDALGEEPQADRARERGLALLEILWGRTFPLAEVLESSADSLMQQGRARPAAELYSRSLEILDHNFSRLLPRVHQLLDNLVAALLQSEQWEAARQRGEQLEQALLESYGSRHPQRLKALSDLGLGLFLQKRYSEAAERFQEVLDLSYDASLSQQVGARYNLGSAWHGAGRDAEAEALYREALKLAEGLGPDHPMRTRLELNLADLQARRNDMQEPGPGGQNRRDVGGV